MAPGGVVTHSSSWTLAACEPHEVLLPRLFGLRQFDSPPSLPFMLIGFFSSRFACGRGRVDQISISVVFGIPVPLRSIVSQKFFVLCVRLRLWTEGFYWYLVCLASSSRLLLVRCSSEDAVELSQRALNFNESGLWTKQSPLQGCCLLCSFATVYLQCLPSLPRAYDT